MCSVSPGRSLTCSNSGKAYLVLLSIIAIGVVLASASVVEEGSEHTRPVIRRSNVVAKKVYGLANKFKLPRGAGGCQEARQLQEG